MSNDRSADQDLLATYRRKLHILQIQAAKFGNHTPAHIIIEIEEIKAAIAELEHKLASGPVVERFREWVVDQMHRGDFLTIGEAIEAVNPGDRILIRPGVYHEALVLNKPLELIGEGEPGDVLVQASGSNVIYFDCARGLVKNLTLSQTSSRKSVVEIVSGCLDLEDCDISGVYHGVLIAHSAHPRLRHNRIHDNQGAGVAIAYNGQGLLEDNDIFGHHAGPAVGIVFGANPVLRRNRIHDNQGGGVLIVENGQGLLEDNEFFSHHARPAVAIKTGANPTLRRNRIHDNQSTGVFILDNGQGLLEDNDIFGHTNSAVVIETGAHPTLRKNRIHDNQSHGVYIYDNGRGLLEENEIFGHHTFAAVAIASGANPTLRRNRIHDNQGNGVLIHDNTSNGISVLDGGGGSFERNVLFNNKQGNWDIDPDCLPRVRRVGNSE